MDKKESRLMRAKRSRMRIKRLGKMQRLSVHRTPRHIYAQIIESDGSKVVLSASSLEKEVKSAGGAGSNVAAASVVGKVIAERAIAAGITAVAFDRSGFKYHGRIRALAEAARDAGLQF